MRLADAATLQIKAFITDYPNALARARAFDAQIESDANKISADYASIVALSIRQTFGAIEITVSRNLDNSYDTSNVLTFMKGKSFYSVHSRLLADNTILQRYLATA